MTRTEAIKKLSKLRELVEHANTSEEERDAALVRIRQLRKRHRIGHFETEPPGPRGRPRKDPSQLRSKMLRFLVTQDEHKKIVKNAKKARVNVSEFIRDRILRDEPDQLG